MWADLELGLEYEGDYGDTFVYGRNLEAEKCIATARNLFHEANTKWCKENCSGIEIYQFIRKKCNELDYNLMEDFDGHRISDFPHHKYTKARLANVESSPHELFWILELQINDRKNRFGAFYEDILGTNSK